MVAITGEGYYVVSEGHQVEVLLLLNVLTGVFASVCNAFKDFLSEYCTNGVTSFFDVTVLWYSGS
jgi:hypothetical protein